MTTIQRLGARLRAARKAAGFRTSKEFLQKYSIPASTYSQHESGSRLPNEEMLLFYSNAFGVNFNWLKTAKGLPYKKLSPSQKEVIKEELTNLKPLYQQPLPLNQPLLIKILEELLKVNKLNLPSKKIHSIASQAIKIHNNIISSNVPKKTQMKTLKSFLTTCSF